MGNTSSRPHVCIECPTTYLKGDTDTKRHLMKHFKTAPEYKAIYDKIKRCVDRLTGNYRNCTLCLKDTIQDFHHFTRIHVCRKNFDEALVSPELNSQQLKRRKSDDNSFSWI